MARKATPIGKSESDLAIDAKAQEWCHSWKEWDRVEQWGAFDLGHCKTVNQVLDWLCRIGEQFLVSNIRLYFLNADGFFLADCVGHDEAVAKKLRQAMRMEKNIYSRESFYCFEIRKPVLCDVDSNVEELVVLDDLSEMIASVKVFDGCGEILDTTDKRVYVDIPIYFRGEEVAKFSCDFCVTDPDLLEVEQIEAFCRLAQTAGCVLYAMREQVPHRKEREERARIMKLNSSKDLYKYVENYLPKRFECRTARFFELRSDVVPGQDMESVLALMTQWDRPTILPPRYRYQGRKSRFLVPLVAAIKEIVVLSDVENEALRNKECEEHQLKVEWKDPLFDDWKETGSMMLVPLLNPAFENEEALGVLMLSGKHSFGKNDTACFNRLDRRLAQRLVDEGLSPKVEAIRSFSRQQWKKLPFSMKDMHELQSSANNMANTVIRLLKRAIPEKDTEKLFAVCEANKDWTSLDVLASDGKLDSEKSKRHDIPTKGTVTLAALHEPRHDVVYRNVEGPNCREYVTPRAVCELACSITSRSGLRTVIIVKSNQYDLSLEEHGLYLKKLATWASEVMLT